MSIDTLLTLRRNQAPMADLEEGGYCSEVDSLSFCRFCLESEHTEANPLFSPCRCTGTSKHVHRRCLHRWRTGLPYSAPARLRCDLCLSPYNINRNANTVRLPCKDRVLAAVVNGLYYGFGFVTLGVLFVDSTWYHQQRSATGAHLATLQKWENTLECTTIASLYLLFHLVSWCVWAHFGVPLFNKFMHDDGEVSLVHVVVEYNMLTLLCVVVMFCLQSEFVGFCIYMAAVPWPCIRAVRRLLNSQLRDITDEVTDFTEATE